MRRYAIVLCSLLLSACADTQGSPEFGRYVAAFESARSVGDVLLDDLAAREMEIARASIDAGRDPRTEEPRDAGSLDRARILGGFDAEFRPDEALFHVPGTTPPDAAALLAALDAIRALNGVLTTCAEGRGLDEAIARARGSVATIAGLGALEGSDIAGGLQAALVPAEALLRSLAEAPSRRAFRATLIETAPTLDATLTQLRALSPTVFSLLTQETRIRLARAVAMGDAAAIESSRAAMRAWREAMSRWVLALDETRVALAASVSAVQTASKGDADARLRALGTLEAATAAAIHADTMATEARRLIAAARRGR